MGPSRPSARLVAVKRGEVALGVRGSHRRVDGAPPVGCGLCWRDLDPADPTAASQGDWTAFRLRYASNYSRRLPTHCPFY